MYEKIFVMEVVMGKKIVVVNAGPRMGWNTETLISEAAKGAESAGAEIVRFDLFSIIIFVFNIFIRPRSNKTLLF